MKQSLNKRENLVQLIIRTGLESNDWVIIDFTLKNCFNKSRIFEKLNESSLLHLATHRNYINCLKVLVEHGLTTDDRDSLGNTCLHIASEQGYNEILCILIEANANPLICNADGKQAVELARAGDSKELLREYSEKCTKTKLIQKLNDWKGMFSDQEYVVTNKEKEDKKYYSLQSLPKDEREISPKRVSKSLIESSITKLSVPKTRCFGSSNEIILEATLPPNISRSKSTETIAAPSKFKKLKNLSLKEFSRPLLRSFSSQSINEDVEKEIVKASGLKIAPSYEVIKKQSVFIKKRRKLKRSERMSMPEMSFIPCGKYIELTSLNVIQVD